MTWKTFYLGLRFAVETTDESNEKDSMLSPPFVRMHCDACSEIE